MMDKTKGLQIKVRGVKTVLPSSRKDNRHVLSIFLYQLGIANEFLKHLRRRTKSSITTSTDLSSRST